MSHNYAYIALGANINNPKQQLKKALQALQEHPEIQIIQTSSLYISKAFGYTEQPDFTNAVTLIQTNLKPNKLLKELHIIEQQQGRERIIRWGPRTCDLDILFYNQEQINTKDLIIPHIGIAERDFVVIPLVEIIQNLPTNSVSNFIPLSYKPLHSELTLEQLAEQWQDNLQKI